MKQSLELLLARLAFLWIFLVTLLGPAHSAAHVLGAGAVTAAAELPFAEENH